MGEKGPEQSPIRPAGRKNLTPAERFRTDIETLANLKLKGVSPISLREQGDHDAANTLSFLIGRLDENHLMGEVDKRAQELRQEQEKSKTGTPQSPPLQEGKAPGSHNESEKPGKKTKKQKSVPQLKPRQMWFGEAHPKGWSGFMNETPPRPKTEDEIMKDVEQAIILKHEKMLANMHNVNQRRGRGYRYQFDREVAQETARLWRLQLKAWGALTWAQKRVLIAEKMEKQVQLLMDLGLWNKIMQGLSPEVIKDIHTVISEHKREQHRLRRKNR